jgi:hypothetical protein
MGSPKSTNQYGLQLLDCNHLAQTMSKNDHKQYVTTFGTWHTGIQMVTALSWTKAPTQSAGCRNDTDLAFLGSGAIWFWKLDLLQILVQRKNHELLYPYWVNAEDFRDTPGETLTLSLFTQWPWWSFESHKSWQRRNSEKKFSPDPETSLCVYGYIPILLASCHATLWRGR